MAGKAGQIIPRGERTWLVRVFMGRDPQSGKLKYVNKIVQGTLRDAQSVTQPNPARSRPRCLLRAIPDDS
jgi:hypothetical protein